MSAAPRARLGKGLGALLGEYLPSEVAGDGIVGARTIATARIAPNPFQPRREFAPDSLGELEQSIRENGLLQPLVVRAASAGAANGAEWELIVGERRWRAVRRLGWTEVPAIVKEIDDRAMLVLAIVENVQRAGLSPLEEAAGYRQLIEDFGFTQAEVAASVGRERSTVTNLLRLLQLPTSVQRMLDEGRLAMGHARALLGLSDERGITQLAREAASRGLSVRSVEERVRRHRGRTAAAKPARPGADIQGSDAHVRHLEAQLQRRTKTEVRIRLRGDQRGHVEIPFGNVEDFDRVVELLLGPEAHRT